MRSAQAEFGDAIRTCRAQTVLFDFLVATVGVAVDYDDLLRFQLVYAVSAFDKLIHDIVRIGIVASYQGSRSTTTKCRSFPLTFAQALELSQATIPPAATILDGYVTQRHKTISFQDPDKVVDGLAYIWSENHKWQAIGHHMGLSQREVRSRLRLIVNRRNAIVHEADMDLTTSTKQLIDRRTVNDATDFIERLGDAIVDLVA